MLNKTVLIGRLVADPELKNFQSGTAMTSFKLAVDRPYVNKEGKAEVDFLPIVTWNKVAESCAKNLNKGRLVAVEGHIQTRSYEDQNGQTRWITEIVANSVKFLDSKKSNKEDSGLPMPPSIFDDDPLSNNIPF